MVSTDRILTVILVLISLTFVGALIFGAYTGHPEGPCIWYTIKQPLNHTQATPTKFFSQRYCVVDQHYERGRPLIFYTGNESPVTVYIDNSKLLFRAAQENRGLLVFAEHRYEGESVPKTEGLKDCLAYCTIDQALDDYHMLIKHLFKKYNDGHPMPVVTFGGSYGGMLAYYLQKKYPEMIRGSLAASAPLWGFYFNKPPVTGVASFTSVGLKECEADLKAGWVLIWALSQAGHHKFLSEALGLCSPLKSHSDTQALLTYAQSFFSQLAMGNYPFKSNYITLGVFHKSESLPAWPLHEVCQAFPNAPVFPLTGDVDDVRFGLTGSGFNLTVDWRNVTVEGDLMADKSQIHEYLQMVNQAIGVWYNVTSTETCFNWQEDVIPTALLGRKPQAWPMTPDYQGSGVCQKQYDQGSWPLLTCNHDINFVIDRVQGVGQDIFWPPSPKSRDWDPEEEILNDPMAQSVCGAPLAAEGFFGLPSRKFDVKSENMRQFGTTEDFLENAHHVMVSNGNMDPWAGGGLNNLTATQMSQLNHRAVKFFNITQGAHHLDLFFDTPDDPKSVISVRIKEMATLTSWFNEEVPHSIGVDS